MNKPRIFYGWYVVGACTLIVIYAAGIISFGFTAVFDPITREFGWSYAQISLASSLRGLEVGLLAPVLGHMVDRWGPRKLAIIGGIFVFFGFLILSNVRSLAMFYGAFAVIAIGNSVFTQTVIVTAVANWFRRNAGIAIGIVTSGWGLGGLMVPVVTKLIDTLEWRNAMLTFAAGIIVVVFPLSLFIRHKPEQYGYKPDGDTSESVEPAVVLKKKSSPEVNITASQAVRDRGFWQLSMASACHSFIIGAIITHVMPYLGNLGITRSMASLVALVLPVVSIVGRISSPWLTDRLGSRKVFIFSFALMTIGLLFFAYLNPQRMWLLVPFVILFCLGWGYSVTSRFSVQRELFGATSFGTILGFVSGVQMLGNMAGAPTAGWIYDTWNSYQGAWLAFTGVTIAGAVLILTIPSGKKNNLSQIAINK